MQCCWVMYLLIHGHLIHISVQGLAKVPSILQEEHSLAHMLHSSLQQDIRLDVTLPLSQVNRKAGRHRSSQEQRTC